MGFEGGKGDIQGDANVGKGAPPAGEPALNGPDLLRQHKEVVGKRPADAPGLHPVEVGDALAPKGKPPATVDAAPVKKEVAAATGGVDLTGPPEKVQAQLQAQRELHLASGMDAIKNASTPEQLRALHSQYAALSGSIQDQMRRIAELQRSVSS